MPNPNPHQARMAFRRKGKPGDMDVLLRVVWHALIEAVAVLDATHGDNPELCLRAVHAVSQCAGQYARLLEIGEHEARIACLEHWREERAVWDAMPNEHA
jgi:hypothetical protein